MNKLEIKKNREKLKLTQSKFAEMLGVKVRAVQSWESGERNISQSALLLLNLILNTQSAGGKIENNNGNSFLELGNGLYMMKVPLLEINLQAGFVDKYADAEFLADITEFHSIVVNEIHRGKYLAFRVNGNSMDNGLSDSILPNSIVTGRELSRDYWSSLLRFKKFPYWVIATQESSYPLLKKIINHDVEKGVITCHSLNPSPEHQDFELSLNDVTALFYVVDINRGVADKVY